MEFPRVRAFQAEDGDPSVPGPILRTTGRDVGVTPDTTEDVGVTPDTTEDVEATPDTTEDVGVTPDTTDG